VHLVSHKTLQVSFVSKNVFRGWKVFISQHRRRDNRDATSSGSKNTHTHTHTHSSNLQENSSVSWKLIIMIHNPNTFTFSLPGFSHRFTQQRFLLCERLFLLLSDWSSSEPQTGKQHQHIFVQSCLSAPSHTTFSHLGYVLMIKAAFTPALFSPDKSNADWKQHSHTDKLWSSWFLVPKGCELDPTSRWTHRFEADGLTWGLTCHSLTLTLTQHHVNIVTEVETKSQTQILKTWTNDKWIKWTVWDLNYTNTINKDMFFLRLEPNFCSES